MIKVQAKIYYDTVLAQFLFNEEVIEHEGNTKPTQRTNTLWEYNPDGEARGKLKKYITRGYCQGDYAEVLAPDEPYAQKSIDHLFWDCPIAGTIEVNGQEYYIDEIVTDPYEYDKETVAKGLTLQRAKRMHQGLYEALMSALPDNPDYI